MIAHRGASHDLAEHTEAAYRQAIADGADSLECDVRLTVDEHLVCVHDAAVERTSSGRGRVSAMTLADLQALDWGSWKSEGSGPADLLTLDRLLDITSGARAAGRPVELAIETKHPSRHGGLVEQCLVEQLAGRGWTGSDAPVRVMSFSLLALRRLRRLAPDLRLVYLLDRVHPAVRDGILPAGAQIAGIGVGVLRDRPGYVTRLHAAGNAVHVWTVDEPDDVRRCLDAQVDAIITNRPRQVLDQLGA